MYDDQEVIPSGDEQIESGEVSDETLPEVQEEAVAEEEVV